MPASLGGMFLLIIVGYVLEVRASRTISLAFQKYTGLYMNIPDPAIRPAGVANRDPEAARHLLACRARRVWIGGRQRADVIK